VRTSRPNLYTSSLSAFIVVDVLWSVDDSVYVVASSGKRVLRGYVDKMSLGLPFYMHSRRLDSGHAERAGQVESRVPDQGSVVADTLPELLLVEKRFLRKRIGSTGVTCKISPQSLPIPKGADTIRGVKYISETFGFLPRGSIAIDAILSSSEHIRIPLKPLRTFDAARWLS
jgi:hypothetical protein